MTEPTATMEPTAPPEKQKLKQTVDIQDTGPCKKHIRVTIERGDVDAKLNDQFTKLATDMSTAVAGFRPGKAPRKLVERRYHKDVSDQVKAELLLQSLEQLADDHDVAPLSPPDLDPSRIEIPKDGPMMYEFDVEVRPHFDLPEYRGLKLRRPVRDVTDEDVDRAERRLLTPYGEAVAKPKGDPQIGDIIWADVTTKDGDKLLGEAKNVKLPVETRLAFRDAVAETFSEQIKGAKAGDKRTVDITMSSMSSQEELRGKVVQAHLEIKDIKALKRPELTHEFLHNFGVHSPEQLRERIRVMLQKRLEYWQRQSAREQVLSLITAASTWELPNDLLMRQSKAALNRRIMEMQASGMDPEEIRGQLRLLQQNVVGSTAQALKEHFVLQKIAEVEKIDVNQEDIDIEIDRLADEANESPRRVRARIEKDDLMESLAIELIERKVLQLILGSAEYIDEPLNRPLEEAVATVEEQAVPGAMLEPGSEEKE